MLQCLGSLLNGQREVLRRLFPVRTNGLVRLGGAITRGGEPVRAIVDNLMHRWRGLIRRVEDQETAGIFVWIGHGRQLNANDREGMAVMLKVDRRQCRLMDFAGVCDVLWVVVTLCKVCLDVVEQGLASDTCLASPRVISTAVGITGTANVQTV